jgi:hypothetical protein
VISKIGIDKKRLTAICMLTLFLFIHSLKLVHSHDHDHPNSLKGNKEMVSKAKHCGVCDYHFSKDAHKQNASFISFKVLEIPVYLNFYQSESLSSIGLSYSDRGPPSLI